MNGEMYDDVELTDEQITIIAKWLKEYMDKQMKLVPIKTRGRV